YQPFGDLEITFPDIPADQVIDYRRSLNLDTGIASVQFTWQGVTFRRDVFASYPANAIVVRLSASRPGALKYTAKLMSPHTVTAGTDTISGGVQDGAIRFEAKFATVRDQNGVTLILAGGTNFKNYKDASADPHARVESVLASIRGKSYD